MSESKADSSQLSKIGLYGLAVMGQNFALNIAEHGFRISVCNRSPAKVDATVQRAADEGNLPLVGFHDVGAFVESISRPRAVIVLVMAGQPVDDTIALLAEHMDEGDIIIDGGNEWFPNSVRRSESLASSGILFMGTSPRCLPPGPRPQRLTPFRLSPFPPFPLSASAAPPQGWASPAARRARARGQASCRAARVRPTTPWPRS